MCTVTIVPCDGGFRVACNRDERRDRPPALPPASHACGKRLAVFPVDPVGGGTWIGVNDAGLAATLLNRTRFGDARPIAAQSRGLIVPRVMAAKCWGEAMLAAGCLDPTLYSPFRLVVVQGSLVGEVVSDGRRLSSTAAPLSGPMLFTSSSLGDALVAEPRRRLFEQMIRDHPGDWLQEQWRFHRHRWPRQPELSVAMERDEATTVNRSAIDVRVDSIDFSYQTVTNGHPPSVMVA
jgi:transport and Golgi organization protein 2